MGNELAGARAWERQGVFWSLGQAQCSEDVTPSQETVPENAKRSAWFHTASALLHPLAPVFPRGSNSDARNAELCLLLAALVSS